MSAHQKISCRLAKKFYKSSNLLRAQKRANGDYGPLKGAHFTIYGKSSKNMSIFKNFKLVMVFRRPSHS